MSNFDFQRRLLDLAGEGRLLLTETERFSHQLKTRYRMQRRESGAAGWESPAVTTLNQWVEEAWERDWPAARPASNFVRWKVLAGCMEESPPPEPLSSDISLVLALDESFGQCLRYGMDPGEGDPANRLVEWRRSVWKTCERELNRRGLFHPAALAERLYFRLSEHPASLPRKVAVAGFEFAGYWERKLLEMFSERCDSVSLALPAGSTESRAVVLADPEQEMYALMEDLTAAARVHPLHELAVVVLDSDVYSPLIDKFFQDLFGPPVFGEQAAYNLSPENSLTKQPLFQAALLPLDFAAAGQSGLLLMSLLRSPYYGRLAPRSRALCQWEWVWREKGIEKGLRALMSALDGSAVEILPGGSSLLIDALGPFLEEVPRTAAQWGGALQAFWETMEFPVQANECDQISWRRLQEIIENLQEGFSGALLRRGEFIEWIRAACEKTSVQRSGFEDAGVQIVSGLEARGLSFRRIYAPGLISSVLPQPVRSLPFLSPLERKRVQGGSAESQYEFAKSLLGQFHAAAPETVLSRPLMDRKGDPCLPTPFWPHEKEERRSPSSPWRSDLPALQRAGWVVQGIEGLSGALGEEGAELDPHPEKSGKGSAMLAAATLDPCGKATVPESFIVRSMEPLGAVTVSALESIFLCRSRFFFRDLLGFEELPPFERGLDPGSRGRTVHEAAASFGRKIRTSTEKAGLPFESLLDELRNLIAETLKDRPPVPGWRVEGKRLAGGGDDPGLLGKWLEAESSRFEDGWRWTEVEKSFSDLKIRGSSITLKGRLDRLDFHPDEGLFCWDYKTGSIPGAGEVWEDLTFPQLPAYLLAVKKGLVAGAPVREGMLGAGYIDLSSAGHLKHMACFKPGEATEAFLNRWEEEAGRALERAGEGDMTPRWLSEGEECEKPCPYRCLCGFLLEADCGVKPSTPSRE